MRAQDLAAPFPTVGMGPLLPRELPVVDPDATVLEIPAVMARGRSTLVALAAQKQPLVGAIKFDTLPDRMLGT